MKGDMQIDAAKAVRLQAEAARSGMLPMWTITCGTADYPGKVAARLFLVPPGGAETDSHHTSYVMVADDLDAARRLVPPGLVCLTRDPTDDPVIVETWF